jgi:uncharacterized protein (TIGR03437 family)
MKRLVICVLFSCLVFRSQASGQTAIISTIAGSSTFGLGYGGFSGDGGPATSALLNGPSGVAVDGSGNLFIADLYNARIRRVSADGIITTVAGNAISGLSGDGGLATSASLNYPIGVAVDASGNLFIADANNNRIRKVSASGIITTVAGSGPVNGNGFLNNNFSGDGGPATSALLNTPSAVVVDASGDLFIADSGNLRIRKVSVNGVITTIAGNGIPGFSGDGGPAISASLSLDLPSGLAVDGSGSVFITDFGNQRIRRVSASGIITTVAGNGATGGSGFLTSGGYSGDGGPATSASLSNPSGVAVDASGNLFIADYANSRIRKVSAIGIITTVAGNGIAGLSGDGGPAAAAELFCPENLAVDASGNLFIADTFNSRIREVQAVNALGGIQNAASYATAAAVSPGEMVVLYGVGMGPAALETLQVDGSTGLLETSVAGTTVWFNGTPAPVIYTSAGQIAAIVPYDVASAAAAQILVNYHGRNVATGAVTVAPSAPGIFTVGSGIGQAAALNQDASVNSASNPAAAASVIVLYLTGEGQTAPQGVDGKIASAAPYPAPLLPVTVQIGGRPATYFYAGAAPGEVAGIMQINANIPAGVTGNAVPVSVEIGTVSTRNGVTIAVQ